MKVIIAGSRHINGYGHVVEAIKKSGFEITEVVSGGASGVDQLGELYAFNEDKDIKKFPAEWSLYGKAAGPVRNQRMAEYGDALIAVWDGESTGTANMIEEATAKGLKVYVHRVSNSE